ncbi:MAG: LysR family transcriptional regulator [Myxococcota bacterium]
MELTQLRYFIAVAEHGSISGAARSLEAKQPTLSVALKNLEDELGATLFHRDSRGISLTASGREFLTAAQGVFELLDRAQSTVSGLESGDVGQFVVGCHEALGAYFLPGFMATFLHRFPRIQISIRNAPSPQVRDDVLDRRVDFGLCVNPEPHPDLVMVRLFRDGVEVYVAEAEPVPSNTIDALARIRKGPLIAARRMHQVRDILARFEADEVMPDRIIDCGDLHVVRSLTAAGVGVGLLPRRVASDDGGPKVKRLHKNLPGYPDLISLLYRADLHRTRAALKLKDALTAHGRLLQSGDPNEGSILPP